MDKIKKWAVDISKKNVFLRKIIRKLILIRRKIFYRKFYKKYEVDEKIILFEVFGGRNYSCSPKYIYEQLIKMEEFKDYKFVWSFIDTKKHNVKENKKLIIVEHASNEYYEYCAKSKYWIVNSIMGEHIKKKENQVYVQCWHGTPLKRLRCDIEVTRKRIKFNF